MILILLARSWLRTLRLPTSRTGSVVHENTWRYGANRRRGSTVVTDWTGHFSPEQAHSDFRCSPISMHPIFYNTSGSYARTVCGPREGQMSLGLEPLASKYGRWINIVSSVWNKGKVNVSFAAACLFARYGGPTRMSIASFRLRGD